MPPAFNPLRPQSKGGPSGPPQGAPPPMDAGAPEPLDDIKAAINALAVAVDSGQTQGISQQIAQMLGPTTPAAPGPPPAAAGPPTPPM